MPPTLRPPMGGRRGERRGERGAAKSWIALVVALVLAGGGVAAWRFDVLDDVGWPDSDSDEQPSAGPASVAPPPGLDLPPVIEPDEVAESWNPTALNRRAVTKAVDGALKDPVLGQHVLAVVAPLTGNGVAYSYERGSGAALIPASTTKLATTTAALLQLDSDDTFSTTTVLAGRSDGVRRVILVGGGDPLLVAENTDAEGNAWAYPERATLADLAAQTAAGLAEQGIGRVRLGYDTSLFTGPAENPTWKSSYVDNDTVTPTSALWINEGRADPPAFGRVDDAPGVAAAAFAAALKEQGIKVIGAPKRATTPEQTTPLGAVESPPVREIVERILTVSDNEAAEVLLRHIGLAAGGVGSTRAGLRAARDLLESAGIDFGVSSFADGSGLSRLNRAEPRLLVSLLRLAAGDAHPELAPILTGLPVAGFNGSLGSRFEAADDASFGAVRAKTGSLDQVRSLAGVVVGKDGVPMLFAVISNGFALEKSLDAWDAVDVVVGKLAACACGR